MVHWWKISSTAKIYQYFLSRAWEGRCGEKIPALKSLDCLLVLTA